MYARNVSVKETTVYNVSFPYVYINVYENTRTKSFGRNGSKFVVRLRRVFDVFGLPVVAVVTSHPSSAFYVTRETRTTVVASVRTSAVRVFVNETPLRTPERCANRVIR